MQVLVAQPGPRASTTEYLSLLKSRHSATLNPLAEGQVTKILVKSGDRAKAGDPLMQIDPFLESLEHVQRGYLFLLRPVWPCTVSKASVTVLRGKVRDMRR